MVYPTIRLVLWSIVSAGVAEVVSGATSCYWTSTVIYGDPVLSLSYGSMTSKAFPTATSEDVLSSTILTSPIGSFSSPTPSTIPLPDIYINPLYMRVDTGGSKLRTRAISYIAFSRDQGYLTDLQETAATFYLTPTGDLLSDGKYVGVSRSSGTVRFERFATAPPDPYDWSTTENGQLSFGEATFCYTGDGQFYVVLDIATDDCAPAVIRPQIESRNDTAVYSSTVTTMWQSTLTSTSSLHGDVSRSSQALSSLSTSTYSETLDTIVSTTKMPSSAAATSIDQANLSSSSSPASSTVSTVSPAFAISTTTSFVSSTFFSSFTSTIDIVLTATTLSQTLAVGTSTSTNSITTTSITRISVSSSASVSNSSSTTSSSAQPISSLSSSSLLISNSVNTTSTTTSAGQTSTTQSTINPVIPSLTSGTGTSSTSPTSSPTTYLFPAKRGLAYGKVNTTHFYSPPSQVAWAYNYYSIPNNTGGNEGLFPETLKFIPTLYNDNSGLTSIWAKNVNLTIAKYGTDAIFSFNEPDACFAGQSACMSVNKSLIAYKKFIAPFAGIVKLGSPAVTNIGPPAGLTWLGQFLGNATQQNLTVDFINIHWYASPYNFNYFVTYVRQAYQMGGGRPVYVTEYGMDRDDYNENAVQTFMKNTTAWLDRQDFVERYAWFGNYPGELLDGNATALTPRGVIWKNYTG